MRVTYKLVNGHKGNTEGRDKLNPIDHVGRNSTHSFAAQPLLNLTKGLLEVSCEGLPQQVPPSYTLHIVLLILIKAGPSQPGEMMNTTTLGNL